MKGFEGFLGGYPGLIEQIWRTYSSKLVGELEGLVTKVARLDTGHVT